jgi:uncharacterized protein YbjT (DUF2867 family)
MTKVLVTGAAGVLGQALLPQLTEAGYEVRAMSRRAALPQSSEVQWVHADLETGAGLPEALYSVEIIIHAASNPRQHTYQTDVLGTERLLKQAQAAGVAHFIFVSIVGIDRIPYSYYKHKLASEALVEQAGVPWSISRITQFHTFIDLLLRALTHWPIALVPTDFQIQPIDPSEAAKRLVESVTAGPAGRLADIGGPEVLSLGEMAQSWLAVRGLRRWLVHLPVPGKVGAGLRQGLNTVPEGRYGQITWADWLRRHYQSGEWPAASTAVPHLRA